MAHDPHPFDAVIGVPGPIRTLAARVRPDRSQQTPDHVLGRAPDLRPNENELRQMVLRRLVDQLPTRLRPAPGPMVAVAASEHVREGLSWEWVQTTLDPGRWSEQLHEDQVLLLVEVAGPGVAGWPEDAEAPAALAAAARALGMRCAAWVTDVTGPQPDLSGFDDVYAADQQVAAALWGADAPHADRLLRAATQPRAQGGALSPAADRVGSILFRDEADAVTGPGTDAAAEGRATVDALVRSLGRTELVAHDWTVGGRGAPGVVQPLSSLYQVLVDIGSRRDADVRPVLDALAARTAVVTTPVRAERLAPDVVDVVTVAEPEDVRRNATVLARQPEYRDRLTHLGLRTVTSGHTYAHRARTLLDPVGAAAPLQERTVSVVVPTNRPHELTNVLENVARQQRVETELVLLLHGIEVDEPDLRARARDLGIEELQVRTVDRAATLGAVLNEGIDASSGAYVAKMDDDNFYGTQFLGDLVDAFTYTSAGITGKWCHYVWLRSTGAVVLRFEQHEHTYHRLVQGGSIVAARDVAQDIRFSDIPRAVDSDFLNRAMAAGVQTYSGDRYNFVSVRGDDRLSHTWKVDDLVFMTGAGRVVTYGDPRDLVSV